MIIDANCLSCVFSSTDAGHPDFAPVKEWIDGPGGWLVIGGSKYIAELARARRYLNLVMEMKKRNKDKVIHVADTEVDNHERRIRQMCRDAAFNDAHLVALVCVSKCKLICTNEREALRYLQRRDFYPRGVRRPRIYRAVRNARLLRDTRLTARP